MSPRREEDDGGPSDEEGSSASEQIQQTPSNIEPAADEDASSDENNPATDEVDEEDSVDNSIDLGEPEAVTTNEEQNKSGEESLTWHPSPQKRSGYESFAGKPNSPASAVPTPFKHEDDTPDDESINRPKSRIATKAARGQVLVHYHPQLGDEGFESTLISEPSPATEELASSPSRGRPMDEPNYYTGGAAGMNSRMMEDVRVERAYTNNNVPPSSPGNDEQNNAATRQIRRRVFRAALERGMHDERRKKMLDADADIGGPSVRGDGGAAGKNYTGAMNLTRSRDADDEENVPKLTVKTDMPVSNESQKQTVSPPAPPAGPPSYRTIIQKLIADNEPQKLPQLDKVMKKYNGREEELILKLDLRYKKMKQKSDAILQDLERSEKEKGGGKQTTLEDRGGIQQTHSWDSKKSKDVYFVKVSEPPLPGAIKLPSDIIDSGKTVPVSNVRATLAFEDEADGDIPALPKRNAAPTEITAAAAAKEAKLKTVEKDEIASPILQEPYRFNMAPSYGDGISVITMETKGTLKTKKNDRGEDVYTWQQRPPNSITVEGAKGANVQESPLSPERQSKINKVLPDFDREKEEDKVKASEAKLESMTLDNVEARIRARRKIMEAEAANNAVLSDPNNYVKANIEKVSDGASKGGASVVEDADSFVGKRKSPTPAQEEEVQLSLIDQHELLLQAETPPSESLEPEHTEAVEAVPDVEDDLDEEEEIDILLKESRLQAEKAIALKKAQRELEKEKKARMEAEAARIALEEELSRLKGEASGDSKPMASQEDVVDKESDDDDDDAVDVSVDEKSDTSGKPLKYDLNKTMSSVSDEKSRSSSSDYMHGDDLNTTLPIEDTDQVLPDDDITEASMEMSQNEVDTEHGSTGDDGEIAAEVPLSKASSEVKESADSTTPMDSDDIDSPPSDEIADAPSADVLSKQQSDADENANINHVATMTFEGNRAKGQLSFITGAKILAHSNQRGPWWLGRCGKQTGWFPANAVVPEYEFLKNIATALPDEMDEISDRLGELSNEELAATYDLIRNPSDPIGDDDDVEDDLNGSPARSRWLDDTSNKNVAHSSPSRSDSPPPTRSDPSKMEGLNQRLYEPNESNAITSNPQLGFEGMNRLGKSVEEHSEDKPKKTYIGPAQVITEIDDITETDSPKTTQTAQSRPGWQLKKKKVQQEWRAVQDPSTGLTYYYHLKTRETTWDKPADFDEAATAEKDEPKAKGFSGGKILRMFSKKKKPKTPTEEGSAAPSPSYSYSDKKGTFVPQQTSKAATKTKTENLVATRTQPVNDAIIFPEHDDDDDSSSSDESSLFSRENMFTKKKLKNTVEKITDKFSQKNDSPKNAYEQLGNDDEKMQIEVADGGIELNYPVETKPKVQWRSAVDAATGRTYYYVKGGTETFWERPKDM